MAKVNTFKNSSTNQLESKKPQPIQTRVVECPGEKGNRTNKRKGPKADPPPPPPQPPGKAWKEAAELTGEGLVGRGPLRGGAASAWKEHQEEAAAPQPHGATATATTPAARRHPAEPSRSFLAAELRKSRAEREEAHCEKRWCFFSFFLVWQREYWHTGICIYIFRGEERASGWDQPVSFREWWPARRRLVMGPTAQWDAREPSEAWRPPRNCTTKTTLARSACLSPTVWLLLQLSYQSKFSSIAHHYL